MVDEPRPTKKVVKKVVKRTVVVRPTRPGAAAPTPSGTTAVKSRRPGGGSLAKLKASTKTRPRLRIPSPPRRPGAGLVPRAQQLGSRVGGRARDTGRATGDAIAGGVSWVRDLRLPHLAPLRAAIITGLVVGLVAVSLGWLAREVFSATRGTSAGGTWGALALVVMAFIAYLVGRTLLSGFGLDHVGAISFTSISLVFVLVLALFLELAATSYSWILLPVLSAIAFAVSCKVLTMAAEQPAQS